MTGYLGLLMLFAGICFYFAGLQIPAMVCSGFGGFVLGSLLGSEECHE